MGTTSFGNEPLFTQQKEKCRLIQCFGPMFIDFDEYPQYSGRESIMFEKCVNESIKCEHGYAYSAGQRPICKWVNEDTWEIMKKCFPDATKLYMCPKTVSCNKCTYVQKNINDDIFYPLADSGKTFSSSYFLKEPN